MTESEKAVKLKHIGWDELDKRKYYFFGPTFMIGVRLLIFPTILIKTRLQVQSKTSLYNGTYDAFKKIFKSEGIRGFYKGFGTNTVTVLSGQVYITTLEIVRSKLPSSFNETSRSLIAGLCGSLAGQTITVPVDIISQKLMISDQGQQITSKHRKSRTAWYVFVDIYKCYGLRGFYKGYLASLLTYTPSSGIWWGSYNALSQFFGRLKPDYVPDLIVQGISGSLSAAVSSVLTNPADVIRTRLQVEGGASTIRSVASNLYNEEGIRALHKGLTARLMSAVPTSFVLITSYELVKRLSLKNEFR